MLAPRHTKTRLGVGGVMYLFVAVLLLLAAYFTQANLLFWAFGLMIGGWIVSVVFSWYSLRGISLQRLTPDHAVVGEPLVLRYQLFNPKRWMPAFNLVLGEVWDRGGRSGRRLWHIRKWFNRRPKSDAPQRLGHRPCGWVLHFAPRSYIQAEATCWPKQRGYLQLEHVQLSTSFPFGIIQRVAEFAQEDRVLVYPPLFRIHRGLWLKLAAADPAGHLQIHRGGGIEEFFGLRRYRPGDSLKSIDWRHSAKTGALICREMTLPAPPKLMLVLDLTDDDIPLHSLPERPSVPAPPPASTLGRASRQDREKAISLASSLICGAHLQGYQVGLAVLGAAAPFFRPHHSLPHRTRMLETLALLDISPPGVSTEAALIPPNLVVRAAPGLGRWRGHKCLVLAAEQMHEYIQAEEGASVGLLARGITPRTKRQRLRLHEVWT